MDETRRRRGASRVANTALEPLAKRLLKHHLVVRVAAQMPNEAMTEAQKKKKMEADRQKKNEQKELDNLNRVFEWCVARLPRPAPYSLLTRER